MPVYEFRCPTCESKDEVFVRKVTDTATAPACANPKCATAGQPMVRALSKFARHLTEGDKLAEAEAKWGKEVNDVMGASPSYAMTERYTRLAKDLPPPEDPALH